MYMAMPAVAVELDHLRTRPARTPGPSPSHSASLPRKWRRAARPAVSGRCRFTAHFCSYCKMFLTSCKIMKNPPIATTRKEMERAMHRQCVLDAARRIMTEKGVEETRMEDTATAADSTRRSLYAYFKSRDEVYLNLMVEDMQARWADQQRAIAARPNPLVTTSSLPITAWSRSPSRMFRSAARWDGTGEAR